MKGYQFCVVSSLHYSNNTVGTFFSLKRHEKVTIMPLLSVSDRINRILFAIFIPEHDIGHEAQTTITAFFN